MTFLLEKNPILPAVQLYLNAKKTAFTEYELLRHLDSSKAFKDLDILENEDLNLLFFYKHFLIMNALYYLQEKLWISDGVVLNISPLKIELTFSKSQCSPENPSEIERQVRVHDEYIESAELRKYYLDFSHMFNQTPDTVAALLSNFWKKFSSSQLDADLGMVIDGFDDFRELPRYIESCEVLGVDSDDTLTQVRLAYRLKVIASHPDRGGKAEDFIAVRQAYEYIKARYY